MFYRKALNKPIMVSSNRRQFHSVMVWKKWCLGKNLRMLCQTKGFKTPEVLMQNHMAVQAA